jgi:biotin carboxyl carrier protein
VRLFSYSQTIVAAPITGIVKKIACQVGDDLSGGDLVVEMQEA